MSVTGKTPADSTAVPEARTSIAAKKVGRPRDSDEIRALKKRQRAEQEKKRRQDFKKRNPVGTDFYQTELKVTLKSLEVKRFWFWLIDPKGLQMSLEQALRFDQHRAMFPHFSKTQWSAA
ncbi:MAG TPA: hypothetical protein VJ201_06755 [Candidatus Babeliales bacterium]|nr:hypothetical protein [Candidatus Babeliales bacterium]